MDNVVKGKEIERTGSRSSHYGLGQVWTFFYCYFLTPAQATTMIYHNPVTKSELERGRRAGCYGAFLIGFHFCFGTPGSFFRTPG